MPSTAHDTASLRAEASAGLVARGIALNAVLAAIKLAGGVFGNSYALIADAVESLLDIFSSALVWGGFKLAARPPDANHPYGHGKASALAGLVVAAVVFGAALLIAFHSVQEILTPHHAPHWFTLPLLAGVVLTKEFFSRRLLSADAEYGATALRAEAWHHRSDALTSAAAFLGIAIALIGGAGYEAADDWAALVACGVIAVNGFLIARTALHEIMDTVVGEEVEQRVRTVAAGVPGVLAVEKCHILRSGLSLLVDIHVHVDGRLSVREGHVIAHAVKDTLVAAGLAISDVAVHIEPARDDAPAAQVTPSAPGNPT